MIAEETLPKQTRLTQSILDNMGEGVVVADASGNIVMFNPMAERMFGAGLVDRAFELFEDEHAEVRAQRPLDRCLRGESFDELELLVRPTGSVHATWVRFSGRPLREGEQIRGAVLVCHDIGERKQAQRRLEAQYAVARAIAGSSRLEEASRLILDALCRGLDMEVGALWTASPDQMLRCVELWHTRDEALREFSTLTRRVALPAGVDVAGAVWRDGRPTALALTADAATLRQRLAWQAGLRGVLAFPVRNQTILGVVEFCTRAAPQLHADIISMMDAMGSQIGQLMERGRVEQALRDSEALYESLVESLPQNIFRKDGAGRVTFANEHYCRELKTTLEQLLGKTDFDLFPRELAAKYVGDDQRVMQTGKPLEAVESHRLPDGSDIFVQVVKTPVFDAAGEIIGVQGIFWDVTERKRAERFLAESERRYRELTEATLDGIVLVDQEGRIELFNPAAERMFGYAPREVLGQPVTLLIPEGLRSQHEQGFRRYLETRAPRIIGRTLEVQGRRKDGGAFPIEISLSALHTGDDDTGPVQFLAAIRDLTERNRIRDMLAQSEKLASLGLLSAGVAHEINNPLAFVANNLAVLERDCLGILPLFALLDGQAETLERAAAKFWTEYQTIAAEIDLAYVRENLERLLQRTRDGIDRVTRIVQSLRGLARTDVPQAQPTALPDLVEGSLEILRGRFKRSGIAVEQRYETDARPPCVSTQMGQVVLNLLLNAFQAVEAARSEGGRIEVVTRRQGDEVLLEISDNGPGIGAEHLPKVFDPFFTTKEVGEGTGLGLAITHNIVAAHGGRIEVASVPGQGATFRVFLPLEMPGVGVGQG